MDTTKAQQIALDDALVTLANRLKIGKCNHRLSSTLKSNEPTLQVAIVSIHHNSLRFKMNNKSHTLNLKNFRDMLKIFPKLPGNLIGKTLEDLVYQVENKNSKKNNDMCYPQFTKVVIDYFMSKDQSISRRNKMFWHTARDDPILQGVLRCCISGADPLKAHKQSTEEDLKSPAKVGINGDAEQIKLATKKSKTQFHSSHTSGSSDGVDTQSKVPNEKQQKVSDDEDVDHMMRKKNKKKQMMKKCLLIRECQHHLNMNSLKKKKKKKANDMDKEGEQEQDDKDDLYKDVNINLERSDAEMTDAQANKDTEDAHVTLTAVSLIVQQQSSSVSSDLVSKFINPSLDTSIDSILNTNIQSHTLINVLVSVTAETLSSDTTIPPPPILINQPLQQAP
ncbi:hypothetical protein Tco_0145553 [Tanacetum coccineum]